MPSWGADLATRLRAWVPRWWRGEGGAVGLVLARVLWPAEAAYRGATWARNRGYDAGVLRAAAAPVPVISVGNLGVGGAGKTPFAAWVAARLAGWGRRPGVVLRGYGADELLVHRELNPEIPVFAARHRVEGVAAAAAAGCDVAVLDDAFQHRALARDLDLVLVAAESWGPPLRLLPRGPWREGLAALRRAGGVVVTRKTAPAGAAAAVAAELARAVPGGRVAVCRLVPTHLSPLAQGAAAVELRWLAGRDVLAVASLADPRPFVEHLRHQGARAELLAFPDHHEFDARDAERIVQVARGRALAMTRKEAVKLRPLLAGSSDAWVLEQRVEVESGAEALDRSLRDAIGESRGTASHDAASHGTASHGPAHGKDHEEAHGEML